MGPEMHYVTYMKLELAMSSVTKNCGLHKPVYRLFKKSVEYFEK